ncbi:MAG TPA: hypothetical protein P5123_07640 [Spirochaetota bacterium]|nr:hypothetical protein [Spirochaetota bacterium]
MLPIVIVSIFAFLAFVFMLFFTALMIFSKKKDNRSMMPYLAGLLVSLFVCGLLVVLDIYLAVQFAYSNKEKIVEVADESVDKVLKVSADLTSRSIRYTTADIWNNWDKDYLEKLENVDLEIKNVKAEKKKGSKVYIIDAIISNKNEDSVTLSLKKAISNNYLFGLDKDEICYSVALVDKSFSSDYIPIGRSRVKLQVVNDEKEDIVDLQFGKKTYSLK